MKNLEKKYNEFELNLGTSRLLKALADLLCKYFDFLQN